MESTSRDIAARMRSILAALSAQLPYRDIENVEDLVRAGEWGVALEILCTQLGEYEAPISAAVYADIVALGRLMKIDASYWTKMNVSD